MILLKYNRLYTFSQIRLNLLHCGYMPRMPIIHGNSHLSSMLIILYTLIIRKCLHKFVD
jgi:hypothetical protein